MELQACLFPQEPRFGVEKIPVGDTAGRTCVELKRLRVAVIDDLVVHPQLFELYKCRERLQHAAVVAVLIHYAQADQVFFTVPLRVCVIHAIPLYQSMTSSVPSVPVRHGAAAGSDKSGDLMI